jgi:hypothetical protein
MNVIRIDGVRAEVGEHRGMRCGIRGRSVFVLAFVLSAVPATTRANPCVLEYVAGRNLLAPSPEPDIFIAREEIRFDLRTRREWVRYSNGRLREPILEGEVSISYEFDNRGPSREVVIGFPIGLYNDEVMPFRNIVSRFHASGPGAGKLRSAGDGSGLTLERAAVVNCERENSVVRDAVSEVSTHPSEAPRYAWYVWPQSFAAGSNKLRVRYHLKVLSAEAGADSRLTISYVLKTTAGWGDGKIGRLDILFSESGSGGKWEVARGAKPPNILRQPRKLQWRLEAFAPEDDLTIAFTPLGDDYE